MFEPPTNESAVMTEAEQIEAAKNHPQIKALESVLLPSIYRNQWLSTIVCAAAVGISMYCLSRKDLIDLESRIIERLQIHQVNNQNVSVQRTTTDDEARTLWVSKRVDELSKNKKADQ